MKKRYPFAGMAFIAILLVSTLQVNAQENLYKISLAEKVQQSSLIVEGKVKSRKSFWNPAHTMIYTSNTVEIYKVFKGTTTAESVEVLTQGGSVGDTYIEASDLLNLEHMETGVFFCYPNTINLRSPATNNLLWDVYSSGQGFINYNESDKSAGAPFAQYSNIETKLYPAIIALTGRSFENKKPGTELFPVSQNGVAATITNYSPTTLWAGATLSPANNLLTITGTGFGNPNASTAVLFPNANDGGATNITVTSSDPLVVSWTNTQIQLRVPTLAGSGNLQVRDANAVTVIAGPISVLFSALTATFQDPSTLLLYTKESNLYNANGTGGYNLVYSTSTAGSGVDINSAPAKATFQRALNTWKEICGFNVAESGTTTSQAVNPSDGLNVVMYDNTNTGNAPLAAGILAVCYSRTGICPNDYPNNAALKTQFDIVIRNTGVSLGSTAFTTGPCSPNATDFTQIDLETVILHELGHALNLGHINDAWQGASVGLLNPSKLMHYAVINSARRITPDYSAKFGADYLIMQQGNAYGTCGITEMIPLARTLESRDDCPLTFPVTALNSNTSVTFDLIHATSNRFVDPSATQVRCDAQVTSITNNAYYAFKTGTTVGDISVAVTGYATSPAAIETCPTVIGAATTGIRLNLYQVNSCPAGGAFPAPFACRTFAGNGVISAFTGLAANTTYLLFAEGIENTKASFSMLLNGSALPLKFTSFTGQAMNEYNQLQWTFTSTDVNTLELERSADGVHFERINSANYSNISAVTRNDQFKDYRPYAGTTYYRLVSIGASGQKEFSNVVALKRDDAFMASIYPNPVKGNANLLIITKDNGQYRFNVYNSTGQLVQQDLKQISNQQNVQLNTAKLAAGSYLLKIYGPDNMLKKSISFIVK